MRRKYSDSDLDAITVLANSGKSVREAAEILGIKRNTLHSIVYRWGIKFHAKPGPDSKPRTYNPPRNGHRWTLREIKQIEQYAVEELTASRVAALMGFSLTQIESVARRYKIKFYNKGGAKFGNQNAVKHGKYRVRLEDNRSTERC